MAKKRVHEIAKEQGVSSKELLASLQAAGIEAKAAASSVDEAEALKALNANGGAPAGDGKAAAKADDGKADVAPDGAAPARPSPPPPAAPAGGPAAKAAADQATERPQ